MMVWAGVLFFGAGAVVLGEKAWTNDRGLILNGIPFSEFGATVFYWVLAGVSALFVPLAVWILFATLVHGVPDVVLTAESISFPVGIRVKRAFVLPLRDIENISQTEVSGQRFLMLKTAAKKHHIALNWLESKEAEQHLVSALDEMWSAVVEVPEYGLFDL